MDDVVVYDTFSSIIQFYKSKVGKDIYNVIIKYN